MLSSTQKRLKDLNKAAAAVAKEGIAAELGINIRKFSPKYDLSRVAELWANLAMVQEMKGQSYWTSKAKESKLEWQDFIKSLAAKKSFELVVFENKEAVFGLAYFEITKSQKDKTKTKAVLEELYLEPNFRSDKVDKAMTEMLQNVLASTGVEFIEFNLK